MLRRICRCWPHPRCSTAPMISRDRRSSRCSTFCSAARPSPCSTCRTCLVGMDAFGAFQRSMRSSSAPSLISPICATPRTCWTRCASCGPTTRRRISSSIRSACRSGRKSVPADFCEPLETEPIAIIPFDINLFGNAANSGRMISEMDPKSPIAETFSQIVAHRDGTGRGQEGEEGRSSRSPEAQVTCA